MRGYHEIPGGLLFECVIYLIGKRTFEKYDIDPKPMSFAVACRKFQLSLGSCTAATTPATPVLVHQWDNEVM